MNFDVLFLHVVDCPNCLLKAIAMFLLALLLGLLLGWLLWSRYKKMHDTVKAERDDYHNRFTSMEKDFAELKYKYDQLDRDFGALRASSRRLEADKATLEAQLNRLKAQISGDAPSAEVLGASALIPMSQLMVKASDPVSYESVLGASNLQIVEGVGPKVEELLKVAGIASWSALAGTSVDKLHEILASGGTIYANMDPSSWPAQAKLAAEGKWADLIASQKSMDGGRADVGDGDTPAKAEQLYLKLAGFGAVKKDDLKIVEGIGPKIEELLHQAGIKSWRQLSESPVDKIQEILSAAGESFRLANPASWPQQAELAAKGMWAELKKLQDMLTAGRA